VIWLLERVAGLVASEGAGTPSSGVTRGIGSDPVLHYFRDDLVDVDSSEEVVVQLPETSRSWLLVAISLHRTGGSATTFAPRIGQAAGFAADGPDDRAGFAAQAVGTPIQAVFCKPIPLRADSSFRVYVRPGFDAGADNDATLQVWIRESIETEESTP
jgi:hypothetical protein